MNFDYHPIVLPSHGGMIFHPMMQIYFNHYPMVEIKLCCCPTMDRKWIMKMIFNCNLKVEMIQLPTNIKVCFWMLFNSGKAFNYYQMMEIPYGHHPTVDITFNYC